MSAAILNLAEARDAKARQARLEERFLVRLVELRGAALGAGLAYPTAARAMATLFVSLLQDTAPRDHEAARESFAWVVRRGFEALAAHAGHAHDEALADMAADLDAFLWGQAEETAASREARAEIAAHHAEQEKIEAAAVAETTALLKAEARERRRKLSAFQAFEEE